MGVIYSVRERTEVTIQRKRKKPRIASMMPLTGRPLPILIAIVFFLAAVDNKQLMTVKDLLAISPTPADYVIPYGEDTLQFGQLRLPEGNTLFPVVIVIHGGCWLSDYDLKHISPLASALTREGFATWSLEYRRIGNEGGGWPDTFRDVARGADHLRELAKKFPLDVSRIIALGHSAGGHLALWLAARPKLPENSLLYVSDPMPIQGVVSLAGVGDLSRPEYQEICGRVVPKLMGGVPSQVPDRYAQGSPIELLPMHVPQILIQGALDQTVSLASAQAYHATALKSGDETHLVVIQEAGHFEVVIPTTSAYPKVREAILSLKIKKRNF
jgi:acetyl esterase/lipase